MTLDSQISISQNLTIKSYFQEPAIVSLINNGIFMINEGIALRLENIDFILNYLALDSSKPAIFSFQTNSSFYLDNCSLTLSAMNIIISLFNFNETDIIQFNEMMLFDSMNFSNFCYGTSGNFSLTNSVFSNLTGNLLFESLFSLTSIYIEIIGNSFNNMNVSTKNIGFFVFTAFNCEFSANSFNNINGNNDDLLMISCQTLNISFNSFSLINIQQSILIINENEVLSLYSNNLMNNLALGILINDFRIINIIGLLAINCNSPILTIHQIGNIANSLIEPLYFSQFIISNIHNLLGFLTPGIIDFQLESEYSISFIDNLFNQTIQKGLSNQYLLSISTQSSSLLFQNLTMTQNSNIAGTLLAIALEISILSSNFLYNQNLSLDFISLSANVIINSGLNLKYNEAYSAGIEIIPANEVIFQSFSANFIICDSNIVDLFGGCYHFRPTYQGNYSISDSSMQNCLSKYVSGALDVFSPLPTYQPCYYLMNNVSFSNNSASFQGGAGSFFFHDISYIVLITNCVFQANSAGNGGALIINLDNQDNYLNITNTSFLDNEADTGGAFSLISGVLTLENIEFYDNRGIRGGVLEIMSSNMANIEYCDFNNNSAERYGGLILLLDHSIANISNSLIEDFNASFGGIAYIDSNSMLIMNSSQINRGNGGIGALIYINNGILNFTNLSFIGITAEFSLFFVDQSIVYFQDISFNNSISTIFDLNNVNLQAKNVNVFEAICESNTQEGCIFGSRDGCQLIIDGLKVRNMQSVNQGGLFFLIDNSILNISNSYFENILNQKVGTLLYNEYSSAYFNISNIYNISCDLIYGYHATISLESLNFENPPNFINVMSYLNIDSSPYLYISNSLFNNLITMTNGGLLYLSNEELISLTNIIINSTFSHIQGLQEGGVIYLEATILYINSSIFLGNSAIDGGSLFFSCDISNSDYDCDLGLFNNSFIDNYASNHGGAIKWIYQKPIGFPTNIFINNTAVNYGNDIASFPIKLAIILYNTSNISQIYFTLEESLINTLYSQDAESGQKLDFSIEFFLVDEENQIIKNTGLAKLYIDIVVDSSEQDNLRRRFNFPLENQTNLINYTSNITDIAGQTSQNIDENLWSFTFDDLTITAKPSTTIFLKITSQEITEFRADLFPSDGSYPLNNYWMNTQYIYYIPMEIGSCVPGEIYDNTTNTCYICPLGTYSYYIFDPACKNCLDNAYCPGSNDMIVDAGYWRSNDISENIYRCSAMLYLCLGGIYSNCSDGYTGILCEVCEDINGNPAQKNYFGLCQECANIGINILISIPMGIGILIILKLLANFFARKDENKVIDCAMIKLLIMHYQMLTLIPNVNTSIGETPNQIFGGLTRNWFSFDCIFSMVFGFSNELNNRMISITLLLLLFAAVSNFALIKWKLEYYKIINDYLNKIKDFFLNRIRIYYNSNNQYSKAKSTPNTPALTIVKNRNEKKNEENKIINIVLYNSIWLYLIQTSMLDLSFLGMSCIDIDGVSYNQYSLNYECWSSDHIIWIVFIYIPNIFIWMIGLTWAMYKWLIIVKKINKKGIIIASVGFKKKFRLWGDVLYLARKMIVIIINTFSNENSETIPFTVFLLISCLLLIHFYTRPYSYKILNHMDGFSLYIVFTTYFTLSYYYQSIDIELANFFYDLLIIMHCFWFSLWIIVFWRKQFQTLIRKIFKLNRKEAIYPMKDKPN